MTRPREPKRPKDKKRVLAQQRSQTLRQGLDEMDVAEPPEVQTDAGPFGNDKLRRLRPKQTVLSRLLGSRPAVVSLQLFETNGKVKVRIRARPRSAAAREALDELASLLRQVFSVERSPLTESERRRLLGKEKAPIGERLLLLTRLAIPPDTTIETAAVPFAPENRGLSRYLSKFAALPDGLPFSLRLLLTDQRGRKRSPQEEGVQQAANAQFLAVPEVILLLAVRQTLARERQLNQVWSDYDIGPELQTTLKKMGLELKRAPSEKTVGRLRNRWDRNGLALFPNAAERRRTRLAELRAARDAHEPA